MPDPTPDPQQLVRQIARSYVEEHAPESLEEFDVVFDAAYEELNEAHRERPERTEGSREVGLPIDAAFLDGTIITSVLWITATLVREAFRHRDQPDVSERLARLEGLLAEKTGEGDRTHELLGRVAAVLKVGGERGKAAPAVDRETTATLQTSGFEADLQLFVGRGQRDGKPVLSYKLHSATAGPFHKGFGAIELESEFVDPRRYFRDLLKEIEEQSLDTEENQERAEQRLRSRGAKLFKALLPETLQETLWEFWESGRVRTLQIVSDEPWIPWELVRFQGRRGDPNASGPYWAEAFMVTRWLRGVTPTRTLPLSNLALVVVEDAGLPQAKEERKFLLSLQEGDRAVQEISARSTEVVKALASGKHDGWHFTCHAEAREADADRSVLLLKDYDELTPDDLQGEASGLGKAKPLVFLNACQTGQGGLSLTGIGGWAAGFLGAGAGAFLGPLWSIRDSKALAFAKAFYKKLLAGETLGEAVHKARSELRESFPGDPSWLGYSLYGQPLASCAGLKPARRPVEPEPTQLTVPVHPWRKDVDPPGALLRAQYCVVPFHRREKELGDLKEWCEDPSPVRVRLYTGPGGIGKTRLALEVALKMRDKGWWTGFVTNEAMRSPEKTWEALNRPEGKLLLIVDYAETNRPFLIPVLREMYRLDRGPVRLILLARAALDWWEQLKGEREGVGELLSGPATVRYSLKPLADSVDGRASSYTIAAEAFSQRLQTPPAETPEDLDADYFERVLLLHMKALIDMEGEERAKGEDHILDRILARERKFWETRSADHGISRDVATGIGRAMAVITLGGGVQGEDEALEVLRGLEFFKDQPAAALTAVARLLHECYPGERWIEPLQPDLLGEHLAQRELEKGADELFDLVLGPRSGGDRSGRA